MKIIFAILFAVIAGLIGMRFAGWAAGELVDTQKFTSPDQHATFLTIAEIGISAAAALVGAIIGVLVAGVLKKRAIRSELV
jgi:membrane associated rhomboid family serine protease